MTERALYYPNISLPGEDWLKANLLLFSDIQRIIPTEYVEQNNYVQEYVEEDLVRSANIYSYGCYRAQEYFLHYLENEIAKRPSMEEYLSIDFLAGKEIFPTTVHIGKLGDEIGRFLLQRRFAKLGSNDFLDLHPALGEALMSTIAIACGEEDGLAVVTENGKVHSWLQSLDFKSALEALLSNDYVLEKGDIDFERKIRNESKSTLALFLDANLDNLSAENLKALRDEREAIIDLKNSVSELSRRIPEMRNNVAEAEHLSDLSADVIRKWQNDRANFSNYWKRFFSMDLAKKSDGFSQKINSILAGGLVGGAGAAAVPEAKLIAAGVGFGIGIINYAATTLYQLKQAERDSPFRYLSLCEKQGVVFVPD